ncbi:hypothetical protein QJS04_geneDACA018051 [Acorus gramineus]|uniref:Ataxin-2 C-terminal domain-containing protein n=1 Tax=Acorus gramineus TaxID=55184 RepID=A0AAV9A960_ACOGR|nr:hypothetical protein QJS04_geneDACA018051 [Acorus gramineus]
MEEALQLPTVTVSESADRQAGKDDTYNKEAVLHSTTNLNSETVSPITQWSATYEISGHALPKKNSNEARCGEIQNGSMLASPSVSEASTTSSSTSTAPCVPVPSKTSACRTNTKEFKLNPGAKTFSPSFANPRTATPAVSSAASMGYVPNIPPVLPVSQPGIEISPLSSRPLPVKFVNYNNLVTGHSDINSQIPHTITGHAGSRQQPIRPGPGYPLQVAPTYMHPNCQTVMVGRFGQLMYVHPMTHDGIPGATVLAQGSPLPFMTPHQAHLPKSQGSCDASTATMLASTTSCWCSAAFGYAQPLAFLTALSCYHSTHCCCSWQQWYLLQQVLIRLFFIIPLLVINSKF